jgi:hypothetical protein
MQPALDGDPHVGGDPAQLIRVVLQGPTKVLPDNLRIRLRGRRRRGSGERNADDRLASNLGAGNREPPRASVRREFHIRRGVHRIYAKVEKPRDQLRFSKSKNVQRSIADLPLSDYGILGNKSRRKSRSMAPTSTALRRLSRDPRRKECDRGGSGESNLASVNLQL